MQTFASFVANGIVVKKFLKIRHPLASVESLRKEFSGVVECSGKSICKANASPRGKHVAFGLYHKIGAPFSPWQNMKMVANDSFLVFNKVVNRECFSNEIIHSFYHDQSFAYLLTRVEMKQDI